MPSRNVVKINIPDTYYHIYSRGVSKQQIFYEEADYLFFLSLLKRYLSPEPSNTSDISSYKKLVGTVEILSYCLMPNHFHVLVYQVDEGGMARLIHGVKTSYSRYFNIKYGRTGPLFESNYKASLISEENYLLHISRYIHLNPDDWIDYCYSSIRAYLYDDAPDWLIKHRIAGLYKSAVDYLKFLNDYQKDRDEISL